MSNPEKQSRLLCLPAEIREKIYRCVLLVPFNRQDIRRWQPWNGWKEPDYRFALSFTCRNIYAETMKLVYSEIPFCLDIRDSDQALSVLRQFLGSIGPVHAQWITRFRITCPELLYVPRKQDNAESKEDENSNNSNNEDDSDSDDDEWRKRFNVEVSEAGLECLRLLRQRCPSIATLGFHMFGPRRLHDHDDDSQCRNVVRNQKAARKVMMRELMEFPSLSTIWQRDLQVLGRRAMLSYGVLSRPKEGWQETDLIEFPDKYVGLGGQYDKEMHKLFDWLYVHL